MISFRPLLALLALSLITGCAYQTPIQRYSESKSKFHPPTQMMSNNYPDQDIYRLFVQGATGYVPVSACRSDAEEQAANFCQRQGKYMVLLGYTQSNPIPYPFNFPKCEIIFACVNNPSSSRVARQPAAPAATPAPEPTSTPAPVRTVVTKPKPEPKATPSPVKQKPAATPVKQKPTATPSPVVTKQKPAPSNAVKQDSSGTLYAPN